MRVPTIQCLFVAPGFLYHVVSIALQVSNGPISNLPFELLHLILEYAIPPRLFLNPSFSFGPNSPWSHAMRQLKSHVLVCKMWWDVGIDLLYRDVTIGQILRLVHSLQFHCLIHEAFLSVFYSCLPETPSRCPRLVLNYDYMTVKAQGATRFRSLFSESIVDLELSLHRMPITHLGLCTKTLDPLPLISKTVTVSFPFHHSHSIASRCSIAYGNCIQTWETMGKQSLDSGPCLISNNWRCTVPSPLRSRSPVAFPFSRSMERA